MKIKATEKLGLVKNFVLIKKAISKYQYKYAQKQTHH